MLFYVFLYFLCGKVVVRLERVEVLACDTRYLLITQLIVVAEVKSDALLGGQGEQCLLEEYLSGFVVHWSLSLQLTGQRRSQIIDALK